MNYILIHLKKNRIDYHKLILNAWTTVAQTDFQLVYYYSDENIKDEYILKQTDNKLFLAINESELNDIHLYFKAMFIINKRYNVKLIVKCKDNIIIDPHLLKIVIKTHNSSFINSTNTLENSPLFIMNKRVIHGFSRWIELNLDKKLNEKMFSYILEKGQITPVYQKMYTTSVVEFVENNNTLAFYDQNYSINMNEVNKLLPENVEMSVKYFDKTKPQLIINAKGGFGNLMFQCLFGYTYAMKLGVNLMINRDYRDVRKNISDYKLLQHLNFCNNEYINNTSSIDYKEPNFYYNEVNLDSKKNYNINGYFQSHRYFTKESLDLLKMHIFKEQMDLVIEAKLYIDDIKIKYRKPIVLVHIRRGDYVNNTKYVNLTENYYINAMNSIQGDCVYLVFSDDVQYVKSMNLFNKNSDVVICEEENVEKAFLKMIFCDHYIIANSTLSLTAYYFRNNENALLLAPFKWFGNIFEHEYKPEDLLPPNAVLIQF